MAAGALFTDEAKKRVAGAIKDVEAETSAEVVVVVQRTSGSYRHVDYIAGAAAGLAMLVAVLFHPKEVRIEAIPLDVLLAFVGAALLTAYVDPLKRLLLGARAMEDQVRARAKAAFVDRGISRTRDRTGILVYVSVFERRVEIVQDVGVTHAQAKGAWDKADAAMRAVLEGGQDLDRFVAALRAFGPALAVDLPRRDDDVNELPDEPVTS